MKKVALISGITGQDGSYLAEQCLKDGMEVHGLVRRASSSNTSRIDHILPQITLHEGDILDLGNLVNLMHAVRPDWIFNLAAQSHVGTSYSMPAYTIQVTGMGAINMMEAMKQACPHARFYQASSSEMFGHTDGNAQNESTVLKPISPYAAAKTMAHHMANIYRQQGYFVACGILFNHESPRRGDNFLTQKVVKAVARGEKLSLGNLDAWRDWGYAPEYTYSMVKIMCHDVPMDFVIGTGEAHKVSEFVELAYKLAGMEWKDYVTIDPTLYRPIEAGPLFADYSRARNLLNWRPQVYFERLVQIMLDHEVKMLRDSK